MSCKGVGVRNTAMTSEPAETESIIRIHPWVYSSVERKTPFLCTALKPIPNNGGLGWLHRENVPNIIPRTKQADQMFHLPLFLSFSSPAQCTHCYKIRVYTSRYPSLARSFYRSEFPVSHDQKIEIKKTTRIKRAAGGYPTGYEICLVIVLSLFWTPAVVISLGRQMVQKRLYMQPQRQQSYECSLREQRAGNSRSR